jgi:hypothetical protein
MPRYIVQRTFPEGFHILVTFTRKPPEPSTLEKGGLNNCRLLFPRQPDNRDRLRLLFAGAKALPGPRRRPLHYLDAADGALAVVPAGHRP